MRAFPATAMVGALAAASVSGCGDRSSKADGAPPRAGAANLAGAAARANLLVVTLDTTRADHLGCYGYAPPTSPNLDRLAREGVLVERALVTVPMTLPSHTSLFTGRLPSQHGVRENGLFRVAPDQQLLAEVLRDAGWRTGAFVSGFSLVASCGLDQGFEVYDDKFTTVASGGVAQLERRADRTVAAAIAWLDSLNVASGVPGGSGGSGGNSQPWFLWLHLFDAHAPYEPPPPFAGRFAQPYDGEIAFADAELGRLCDHLATRGQLDGTLVVVTADHGEGLGDHGEKLHGLFLYDSTVWVPLVLRHPALGRGVQAEGAGRRGRRPADAARAARRHAIVRALGGISGRELPARRSRRTRPNAGTTSRSKHRLRGSSTGSRHSRRSRRRRRSSSRRRGRSSTFEATIGASCTIWRRRGRPRSRRRAPVSTSCAAARRNRRLRRSARSTMSSARGCRRWATSPATRSTPRWRGGDPKDALPLLNARARAFTLVKQRDYAEVERVLRPVVQRWPRDAVCKALLGHALVRTGQTDAAIALLIEALALRPDTTGAALDLADAYRSKGEVERALAAYDQALAHSAGCVEASLRAAELRAQLERWQRSLDYLKAARAYLQEDAGARIRFDEQSKLARRKLGLPETDGGR